MKGNRKILFERRKQTASGPFRTTFNSIPIILILLTNKNVGLNHSVTICER